jgi:N-acetylneuraminic acid mutarotase
MVGGFVGQDPGVATDDIWRYSISANTWTKMTWELPQKLAAGGAALIGRELHWIGGSEASRVSDTGSHWVLNIDNPNAGWTELAPMPNPRHHFSTAVVDGKIYVFGGQHGHDTEARTQDNTAHVYNPATNTWTALRNLPRALSHAEPGTFVMNGRIYIGGGLDVDRIPLNTLTEYDPTTNTYREMTPLPNSVTAPVVQYVGNNRIFFTAGTAEVGGAQNKSWLGTLA